MSLSLDEFCGKIIDRILLAESHEEVGWVSGAAMQRLEDHHLNPPIIASFVAKIICELELFNPMDKNAQEWSNIRMARIQFKRIRQQLRASVGSAGQDASNMLSNL
jgi:hypothetical protein